MILYVNNVPISLTDTIFTNTLLIGHIELTTGDRQRGKLDNLTYNSLSSNADTPLLIMLTPFV